jgi:hypothetical protein
VEQTAVYECKRLGDGRLCNPLPKGQHWQIIEMYWNTAMQPNNIWYIAFEAQTKEILTEVC